jgi:hypothetical protein
MSKVTRRPEAAVKRVRKQSDRELLSPRVREMVDELHKLCDAIEGGTAHSLQKPEPPRIGTARGEHT